VVRIALREPVDRQAAVLLDVHQFVCPKAPHRPKLIIDDLGMRQLAHKAAENFVELNMRRYERASALLTSNRPVDDCGKLLGFTAAVTALLGRCCITRVC
jgi:hypothetical protein